MFVRTSMVVLFCLGGCVGVDVESEDTNGGSSGPGSSGAGSSSGSMGGETTGGTAAQPPATGTGPEETGGSFGESTSETPGSTESSTTFGDDDASTTATTGDERPSAECLELSECCEQIGADLYAGCNTVVQMENADLCDSILTTYHQDGYCTGESFCAELGDCCAELPPGVGWQDTCEYYADLGNQPQCAMLIGDYQLSGYCQ